MNEFWRNKIKAFLHDPPDKALILFYEAHEKRRDNLLNELELRYDKNLDQADHIASAMQRLDIPKEYRMDDKSKPHIGFRGCRNCIFWPEFKHTLSGAVERYDEINDFIAMKGYNNFLKEYEFKKKDVLSLTHTNDWKKTYFSLWRFLPEIYPLGYLLSADTRIPDHSIWDHLDVTAAISSCLEGGLGLFSVKIPAVQEFISQSRKLADLWAASHIFSAIIFEGIKKIAEEYGPDVVIYPQLRGNPMVDLELVKKEDMKESLQIANFPNTFLCFVPVSKANEISKKVEDAIKGKWNEMANKAKDLLNKKGINVNERLWNKQIGNTIEATSVWLEFFNFDKFNNLENEVPEDLKERQEKWLSFTEDSKSYKGLKVERHGLREYRIFDGKTESLMVNVSTKNEFIKAIKDRGISDREKIKILESLYEWLQSDPSHFYYMTYELLGIILAQKSRFWSTWEEEPITDKKCLMCGRRNALVERFRDDKSKKEFYRYWKDKDEGWEKKPIEEIGEFKHLLKEGERLCAVCLTKRLYGWRSKSVFEEIFEGKFKPPEQESVVHVAARDFIDAAKNHPIIGKIIKKDIELIYEHEWGVSEDRIPEEKKNTIEELKKELNKSWKELKDEVKKSYEQFNIRPNKYYAILKMDGDRIGRWLSGERWKEDGEERGLPNLGEFLHPAFKNEILKWNRGKDLVDTQRILTPSHHIAISRAMKDFSLYVVPKIVEKHKGFLVYAGGDDVLALFPADKVLDAAYEIQEYFKKDFYEVDINGNRRKVMGLGNKASMSAGIVFTHYKWPLYDAIEKVRDVEKKAKREIKRGGYGRNAFCMAFIKHSGDILTAGGKWDFLDVLRKLREVIGRNGSPDENPIELLFSTNEEKRKLSHGFIHDLIDIIIRLKKGDGKWEEPFISMLKAEIKRLLNRRNYKKRLSKNDIEKLHEEIFSPLIDKYVEKRLPVEDVGVLLKILYDAYRGEER